jgi:glyceraldehyde 3-phosphate dehydrogenase
MMSKIGKGQQLRLRAIVTRDRNDAQSLEKRASLLQYDSVHGDFHGSVSADLENNALLINGTTVHVITANSPEEIDYTQFGIKDFKFIEEKGVQAEEGDLFFVPANKLASFKESILSN